MTAITIPELFIATDTWHVDPTRSAIGFRIKHQLIESVWGRFLDFDGQIEPGATPRFVGSIRVASLVTDHEERDRILLSADYFDAQRFPELHFVSTKIGLGDVGSLLVAGDLTIKNTTRPTMLEGTFAGTSVDADGRERVGLELRGQLNRLDFDLAWDRLPETSSLVVANTIELALDIVAERARLERAA